MQEQSKEDSDNSDVISLIESDEPASSEDTVKSSTFSFPKYGNKFAELSVDGTSIQNVSLFFGDGKAMLKNGVGTAALLIIAGMLLKPALELLCGMLAFRITAAVLEPFSDERIVKMLDGIADTVSLLLACTAAAAAMFTVTVVMAIAAGGAFAGV